uniref:Uncharacterized protein n=1 Tax=Panagrolaimus davidi TaxID=227884 RepID=A0A914QFQ7_9BILA
MIKVLLIISVCCFVLALSQYEASKPQASKQGSYPDESVSGGQQEAQKSDDEEINHEFSFSGKSISRPEPILPRVRGDGPAPASYPPLKPHDINEGFFGGKGGFEEPKKDGFKH